MNSSMSNQQIIYLEMDIEQDEQMTEKIFIHKIIKFNLEFNILCANVTHFISFI